MDFGGGNLAPNSVVVIQDDVSFRIALGTLGSARIGDDTDLFENYMTSISNSSQAKLDMKSAENTANILKVVSSIGCAAGKCNAYTFPDGVTRGLLPAKGWLDIFHDNITEINTCVAACGFSEFGAESYSSYWSSTFHGAEDSYKKYFWFVDFKSYDTSTRIDAPSMNKIVLPFAEFN